MLCCKNKGVKKLTHVFYLSLILLLPLISWAQETHITKKSQATSDEFYVENVHKISYYIQSLVQDKEGFIWIGTNAGLYKYDGYKFKHISKSKTGLPVHVTPSLFVDSEGLIWIGTLGEGAVVYNKKDDSYRQYKHNANDPYSISDNSFEFKAGMISEDKDGLIWLATQNGLNSFDKKTGHFTSYFQQDGLADNFCWSVDIASDGTVWIATKAGLSRFDKITGKFKNYLTEDINVMGGVGRFPRKNLGRNKRVRHISARSHQR